MLTILQFTLFIQIANLRSLYVGCLEAAVVTGDIHLQLFTAVAQVTDLRTRTERATALVSRLNAITRSVSSVGTFILEFQHVLTAPRQANESASTDKTLLEPEMALLDLVLDSLLVVVYRTFPASQGSVSPLQCSTECINAARSSLHKLIATGRSIEQNDSLSWTMLLNV